MGRYGFGQGVHPDRDVCGEGGRDGLSGRYEGSRDARGVREAQGQGQGQGQGHGAPESGGGSRGAGSSGTGSSRADEHSGQGAATSAQAGPGYPRSDERIEEELHERLGSRADLDLSNVTLEAVSATVTLRGAVPEHWMRQAIEDITDHCFGVEVIDNGIRVEPRA